MVGRRVLLEVDKEPAKPAEVRLEVQNLTVKDEWGVPRVDNVSFKVRDGEIVGIAGVSEMASPNFWRHSPASGRLCVRQDHPFGRDHRPGA